MSETAITDVLTQLDTAIATYVFGGYSALATALEPAINLALIAYVAFVGWSTTQSWSQFTSGVAVKHTMKIIIVVMLATHWDFFSTMIYNVVTNGPDQISGILVGASGHDTGSSNEALQKVFNDGMKKSGELWEAGGMLSQLYYLASVVVCIFSYAVAGIALLEISVAKCSVGVLVALAPLLVCFLLWEGGKGVFTAWLKALLGFAFVPIILSSVLMLLNPIMQTGIDSINPEAVEGGWGCLATFGLGCIASIGVLLKSAQMATGLGGGLSVSAMDAVGGMKSAAGMAMSAGGIGKSGASAVMKAGRWAKNKIKGK